MNSPDSTLTVPPPPSLELISPEVLAALAWFHELERGLAYSYATGLIEGCCQSHQEDADGAFWFDVDDCSEGTADEIKECVEYLQARGLVTRHPEHPSWVLFQDEGEAL